MSLEVGKDGDTCYVKCDFIAKDDVGYCMPSYGEKYFGTDVDGWWGCRDGL